MYGLPEDYKRNLNPIPFDDHAPVVGQCEGWEWQPEVYPLAADLASTNGSKYIVDIGCGAGRKLFPLAGRFEIFGIDREEIVQQIPGDWPGTWLGADFEVVASLDDVIRDHPVQQDPNPVILVCSDVIEHLVSPDRLMNSIYGVMEEGDVLVLSTPDRERARGVNHRGPCPNRGHVQEWALGELVGWVASLGFRVHYEGWTLSNDHEPDENTCLLVLST